MTIICNKEFYEAVRFAEQCDRQLDAVIGHMKAGPELDELLLKRGQAVKSLLACFSYRANDDANYNSAPYMKNAPEIVQADGVRRVFSDEGRNAPIQETFVYSDFAPYSFFFREMFVDPITRQHVEIYDRSWYVFKDGSTQKDADEIPESALPDLLPSSDGQVYRTFNQDTARDEMLRHSVVREVMTRRVGMCGGIIFHPDYGTDGKKTGYGSWSTHT